MEAEIENADTLTEKAALAMFGDAYRGGDVLRRLNSWRPAAANTYQALNRGAHDGHHGSLRTLVGQARVLTETIRERLR